MAGLVNIDVGTVLSGLGNLAKDVRIAITGKDPAAAQKLLELEAAAEKAQTDINLAEAQNPNLFVSGWRPAVGWTCVLALIWNYIVAPLLIAVGLKMPGLDVGELITLLLAVLGVGGLRTYEKAQGVTK